MFDSVALHHSLDIVSSEPCSPIQLKRARSLEGPSNAYGSKPRSPPRSPSSPPNPCTFLTSPQQSAPYYAGGAYNNSPPPSSLPAPEFSMKSSSSPPFSPCTSPVKSHSQPPHVVGGLSPKCLGSPQPVYNHSRVLQFDQAYLPQTFSMAPPTRR
jgi:hypothetical protein